MAEALRKAGKPFELIAQNGADHWLSRGDTRLQTLTAAVGFLEKHNPSD
jgi:dipeptidyl aminopeptidase/acylaminoacyl peptidase